MTPEAWLLLAGGRSSSCCWPGPSWTLVRLRRLEARVARAWTALDAQLQRRAGLAEELARELPGRGGRGRGPRYLAAFAADARAPVDGDRELAENLLGPRAARAARRPAGRPGGAARPTWRAPAPGSALARRFYNDAVRDTRALRAPPAAPAAAAARLPAAAAVLRHRRPAGRGSTGAPTAPVGAAAERPYDGRFPIFRRS